VVVEVACSTGTQVCITPILAQADLKVLTLKVEMAVTHLAELMPTLIQVLLVVVVVLNGMDLL
jgi:hypothetical protein